MTYPGNIGIMELIQFNRVAKKSVKAKVDQLIKDGKNKEAWKIIQKTLGVKLMGKEFN